MLSGFDILSKPKRFAFTLAEVFHPLRRSRRAAFTLAEVLITLGIIGGVAALTLPSVISKYQKHVWINQLKAVTSEISTAILHYRADNDNAILTDTPLYNNADELHKFFLNYFKIAKDCNGNYRPCFSQTQESLTGNFKLDFDKGHSSCNVVVSLANGATICADAQEISNEYDENGNLINSSAFKLGEGIISIEVDTNGQKGPNVYGRDLFQFFINNEGKIFDKYFIDYNETMDTNHKYITNGTYGQIIHDNWEMKY